MARPVRALSAPRSPAGPRYGEGVCRSIKRLRRPEGAVPSDEVEAAALQFVRKVSGIQRPSAVNQAAFDQAVAEITASSRRLLDLLPPLRSRTA